MDISIIIGIVTFVVTLILGIIAKKNPKFNNYLIPIQNIVVGIIATFIEYLITKKLKPVNNSSGIICWWYI